MALLFTLEHEQGSLISSHFALKMICLLEGLGLEVLQKEFYENPGHSAGKAFTSFWRMPILMPTVTPAFDTILILLKPGIPETGSILTLDIGRLTSLSNSSSP